MLLRRIAAEFNPAADVSILPPFRRPRGRLLGGSPGELERAVEFCAIKARPRGAVFVLLDSDDDCPAKLGPALLARAAQAAIGLPVAVVLAKREFEAWFLAAAESIRGRRGLPQDLESPETPEEIRGAKEWLRSRAAGHRYLEVLDQPALAAVFDLKLARMAPSFDKCYREFARLIELLIQTGA